MQKVMLRGCDLCILLIFYAYFWGHILGGRRNKVPQRSGAGGRRNKVPQRSKEMLWH